MPIQRQDVIDRLAACEAQELRLILEAAGKAPRGAESPRQLAERVTNALWWAYCTPAGYASGQVSLDQMVSRTARRLKVRDRVHGEDAWERLATLTEALAAQSTAAPALDPDAIFFPLNLQRSCELKEVFSDPRMRARPDGSGHARRRRLIPRGPHLALEVAHLALEVAAVDLQRLLVARVRRRRRRRGRRRRRLRALQEPGLGLEHGGNSGAGGVVERWAEAAGFVCGMITAP